MSKERTFKPGIASRENWDEIIGLWYLNSDWGDISKEILQGWVTAPYEECDIPIIRDEEERIVGMCFLTYTKIRGPKGICKGVRFSAPIISNEIKGSNLMDSKHPIIQLIAYSLEYAAKKDTSLVYSTPYSSWARVIEMFPNIGLPKFHVQSDFMFKFKLEGSTELNKFNCFTVQELTPEHEMLWVSFAKDNEDMFTIERTNKWMAYKCNDFLKIEIRDFNKCLLGLLIYDPIKKLVYDIIQYSNSVDNPIMVEALNFLKSEGIISTEYVKIAGTKTNLDAFSSIDLLRIEFKHTFAVAPLSDLYSYDQVSASNWYLTSLD